MKLPLVPFQRTVSWFLLATLEEFLSFSVKKYHRHGSLRDQIDVSLLGEGSATKSHHKRFWSGLIEKSLQGRSFGLTKSAFSDVLKDLANCLTFSLFNAVVKIQKAPAQS